MGKSSSSLPIHRRRALDGTAVYPGRGCDRASPLHRCQGCHAAGSYGAKAEEGLPILESALIPVKIRPVLLSHEGYPISGAQGIYEASFLCPPASPFILRHRVLLLKPAPLDAGDDWGGFVLHGSLVAWCGVSDRGDKRHLFPKYRLTVHKARG